MRPSKTRLKQESHQLQSLGGALVALPQDRLDALPLSETLFEAVREFKRTRSHEGRRRQMQYIGKLMRDVDTAPILARLDAWKGKSQNHIAYMHQLERWRDRLLENDAAFTELLGAYPATDAQRLRTLIRNAQKEIEAGKPPKNFREIFQVLREIIPDSK